MRTAVVSFGRMNPPTVGHAKLVDKLISIAKKEHGDPLLYASHSHDKKKNPLQYTDKIRYLKMAFGRAVQNSKARNLIEVLKEIESKYDNVIVVVGSDRVNEFDSLLNRYNGREYTYDSIKTVSAGDRDPDAEGISGMSASKMRAAAVNNDVDSFRNGLPIKLQSRANEIIKILRKNMGINEEHDLDMAMSISDQFNSLKKLPMIELYKIYTQYHYGLDAKGLSKSNMIYDILRAMHGNKKVAPELNEALNIQQRMKRKQIMRRLKNRIMRGRKIAMRRKANPEKLRKRAQKQARNLIRKRIVRGKEYSDLTFGQKQNIDKRLVSKKAIIARLAKRFIPKVRSKEAERMRKRRENKESFDLINQIDHVMNLVERVMITRKIQRNLLKKSVKYGVAFNDLKETYIALKNVSNLSEEEIFAKLNSDLCKIEKKHYRNAKNIEA